MKVLIVEDELLARVGLHSLIDADGMGLSFLPDAKDGREAWDQILAERPDIMLLDLNIPEISGLELLRRLNEKRIYIKTIVVSCFDDFDTVKEAMQLGAADYIRKYGLSREELAKSLSRIIDLPAPGQVELRKSAAKTGDEIRQRLLHIPEKFRSGSCVSIYMLYKYAEEMTDMKITETVAVQYFEGLGRSVMPLPYEGKLILLVKEGASLQEIRMMHRQISLFIPYPCYVGLTQYREVPENDRLFVRLAESVELLGFYGAMQDCREIPEPVEVRRDYPLDIHALVERLERGMRRLDREQLEAAVQELFSGLRQPPYVAVSQVRKLFIELLSLFSNHVRSLGGDIEELEVAGSTKHYRKMVHITALSDMEKWWMEFIRCFSETFYSRQKRAGSDILRKTLDYVEEHLTEAIQLQDIAHYAGVSVPYLSSFFKKEMQENLVPYISRMKVERAKELFREGYMIYQVSEMLGYEDSTYFSKVFKRVTGSTPEQYRKKM